MKNKKIGDMLKVLFVAIVLQAVPIDLVWAAEALWTDLDTGKALEGLDKSFKYSDLQQCTTVSEQHASASVEHQSQLQSLQEQNLQYIG